MKEMFRLTILLALVAILAAACSETKTTVPGTDDLTTDETVTDNAVIDETVYDEDATGDKDDVFAEGPLSDDSPMVTDETVTDADAPQTDSILPDDVLTDGEIPDEVMNDELLSDEDVHQGEGGIPDSDQIPVPPTCAEGYVALEITIYHFDESEQKVFGVAGSFTTDPVGQPTTEGDPVQNICYPVNSTVQIHLTANSGYTFSQWMKPNGSPANDVTGTFPDFSVMLTTKGKRISAEFTVN
ncbi:MAG TPA: hypothetical protein P5077_05255 [bacterium]|nr:hypothetical protein [bacterium]